MNPEDLSALLPALRVDEIVLLLAYRKLDADLKEDIRRFTQAVLKSQNARAPSNVVELHPRKILP